MQHGMTKGYPEPGPLVRSTLRTWLGGRLQTRPGRAWPGLARPGVAGRTPPSTPYGRRVFFLSQAEPLWLLV